jgi:hypothetical protein
VLVGIPQVGLDRKVLKDHKVHRVRLALLVLMEPRGQRVRVVLREHKGLEGHKGLRASKGLKVTPERPATQAQRDHRESRAYRASKAQRGHKGLRVAVGLEPQAPQSWTSERFLGQTWR